MKKRLMEALSIQTWVNNNFIGTILDPLEAWQCDFLNFANQYEKPILANCCRGSGKTELAAIVATHTVIFRENQTVLLASPGFTQSKEAYRRCRKLYDKYESDSKPYLTSDSKSGMELSNGSRLVTISGGNPISPRSFRSNLILCDELAYCDREMVESALIPSQAGVPGARIIFISTPNGKEGNIFYEYWESAPGSFNKILIPADKSKRISEKYLAQQKAVTRPERFEQEYFCRFIAGGERAYFDADVVDRCFVNITGDYPISPLALEYKIQEMQGHRCSGHTSGE